MEFSRQEYWSGYTCPSPGDLLDPEIEPRSPAPQAVSSPSEPPRNSEVVQLCIFIICVYCVCNIYLYTYTYTLYTYILYIYTYIHYIDIYTHTCIHIFLFAYTCIKKLWKHSQENNKSNYGSAKGRKWSDGDSNG